MKGAGIAFDDRDPDSFYTRLFTVNPDWSTLYPNIDEARRWAKICEFLSQISRSRVNGTKQQLRILDVGCGRGWLTHWANVYGQCDGVDPVANVIELARRYYPDSKFYVGTLGELLQSTDFKPYDIVIASEVIEHVIDKELFVNDLSKCLEREGYVILTTPRGEEFRKWLRLRYERQPVEEWMSEKKVEQVFSNHQLLPLLHDRVYLDLPGMSLLHRSCSNRNVLRILRRLGLLWLLKGLQYVAGFYQVWLFQKVT